ncbi:MAG: MFS transporter, partial [Candidatus Omnitrophica bacterium]|nr:MFS transporter [Candidatus Omnitrophota bacterium]
MHNQNWFPDPETGGPDIVLGGRVLAVIIGFVVIFGGILPAIFNKEHFDKLPPPIRGKSVWDVVKNMFTGIAITFKNKLFVKICAITFLIFNGFMLSATFIAYVIFFYVFAKAPSLDLAYAGGGKLLGWYGSFSAVCTMGVVALIPWMSRKLGKRNTFFITIPLSIVGYALKWFGYNQGSPYLLLICAPFITFGLGSLFTLTLSMVADVCDLDELQTGERREGVFSAVYWWMVKLGLALASFIGGALLTGTGFKQELGLGQAADTLLWMRIFDVCIPIVTSILALFVIATIDITEGKAHEVRLALEKRRGKA